MIAGKLDEWPAESMFVAGQIAAEPSELDLALHTSFREIEGGDLIYLAKMHRGYYVMLVKIKDSAVPGVSLMYCSNDTPRQVMEEFVSESGLDPGLVLWVSGEASRENWWRAAGA